MGRSSHSGACSPVRGTVCTVPPDPICSLVFLVFSVVLVTNLRTLSHLQIITLPSLVPVVPHRSFCIHLTIRFPKAKFFNIYFSTIAAPWIKVLQQFDLVTEGGP